LSKGEEIEMIGLLTNMAQQNNNHMGSSAGAANNLPPGFMDAFTNIGAQGDSTGTQPALLTNMFTALPGMNADLDACTRLVMDFENNNLHGGLFDQMFANPGPSPGGMGFLGGGGLDFGGPQGTGLFGPGQEFQPAFDPMGMQAGPIGPDPMMPGPLPGGFFGEQQQGFGQPGMGDPMYQPQPQFGYGTGFEPGYGQLQPGFGEPYPGLAGPGGLPPMQPNFDPQYTSNPYAGQPSDYPLHNGYQTYPQNFMQGPSY
jgi:hypothetical protein